LRIERRCSPKRSLNPEYPNTTDEDGDVAQEFYLEFGGKMFQYDPKVFTTEQFLATLQQQKEESNSLTDAISDNKTPLTASPSHHERTTTHPSSTNTPPHSQKKRKNRRTRSRKRTNISNPQPEDTVINLSNVQLSDAEIKLLSRGLTFVPTGKRINWSEVQADINDFARRLRLREFFDNDGITTTDSTDGPFKCKGSWTPPCGREVAHDAFINAIQQDLMFSKPTRICDNLPKPERRPIKQLQKRVDIV